MNTVGDKYIRPKITQILSKLQHVTSPLEGTQTETHMSPKKEFQHQIAKPAYNLQAVSCLRTNSK